MVVGQEAAALELVAAEGAVVAGLEAVVGSQAGRVAEVETGQVEVETGTVAAVVEGREVVAEMGMAVAAAVVTMEVAAKAVGG